MFDFSETEYIIINIIIIYVYSRCHYPKRQTITKAGSESPWTF